MAAPDILCTMPPTGLFPSGGPRPTTSRGEQAMYRALGKGLPEGWCAWHSLRVRTSKNAEGEGDFVVAIPDRGILVIEVRCDDGHAPDEHAGELQAAATARSASPRGEETRQVRGMSASGIDESSVLQ